MKLHILSDLHTEFADFSPPETDADVVVLAGDIGVGTGGIDWAARQLPVLPVIYVPGNHEYYRQDIGMSDELKTVAPQNIHVLNDDASVPVESYVHSLCRIQPVDFGLCVKMELRTVILVAQALIGAKFSALLKIHIFHM